MKKNNVRLICTSVASGDKKNYAVVPVKVKEKKIDYTEDEIKVLAESILNPKTRKQPAYDEPLEDVVENDAPVEEAQEDTIVAEPIVVEPEVEEAEEAPADEPVYEATEVIEPVAEEAEEAPADEPVYEAVEVTEPVAEEAEEAPADEPVYEATEADEPVAEEAEEAPADEPVYEATEVAEPVAEEAEEAPADEPVYEATEVAEPVAEEAEEAPADEPVYEATEVTEPVADEAVEDVTEEVVEETAEEAAEEVAEEVAEEATEEVEETPVAPVVAPAPAYAPVAEEAPVRKRKRGLSLTTKKALSGWLFVLPFVIGILFIYAPIIFDSIRYTFVESESIYTGTFEWVGFENYVYIFTEDPWFSITIVDGLKDLILQIPAIVIFSLFMAIILNQKMAGRTVFRAIFFLPVILCTGIIDTIDTQSAFMDQIEGSQGGIDDNTGTQAGGIVSALDVEALLSNIKLGSELVDIVTTLINNIFDIVSRSGVQMLIFLSGLQSISPAIYESCQVEGASAWETFWKITLPMISPMILVNAIYTVIDLFTAADNRVMSYIFGSQVYGKSLYAEAGAMAWVYIGIVLVFIVVVALLMKTVVFYQKRD